ncbi:preprotein translocase subunit SecE [Mycobacterium montefiorense]|uniref:Protein translocase subunit SecE n=1 Tax=Mycobacterium montefiorense TaxID=154654 RepID=A0AA37PPJ5_9MYCO|nr:preprotein translocase subunit SecE [Mycobacterium montefiorense]GBG40715.1 protein translocase subunit SecE [Mycobacterium montefiorense]GKU33304.1 protein translocase subunit SecE [Mycobacterium montefiorense]GKU41769.1 protein translocase subunit SecE [Mycobacterium montefiorense]GKU44898.1 protein translocase subunit SecE [Mycobacterium montefiorense]GKU52192.1 protein translocase subunit SecE [Mycobacterium montefiorense]
MSDEGDAANDAARDGGDTDDSTSGGRTAVVTKPATRPQRPTGKRSRQRVADADDVDAESSDEAEDSKEDKKTPAAKKAGADKKAKKPKKPGDRTANPFVFVYNYLKQVVAEMRKVIWPNRKQMLTYTSVVLVFLAFMVALVGLADLGLTKLVLLVFG